MAKRERKPVTSRLDSQNDSQKQEEVLESLQQQKGTKEEEKPTTRITIDLPTPFHKKIKDHVDDRGQTIKGFFINLAKEYFEKLADR